MKIKLGSFCCENLLIDRDNYSIKSFYHILCIFYRRHEYTIVLKGVTRLNKVVKVESNPW